MVRALTLAFVLLVAVTLSGQTSPDLLTRAESTNYEETSRYDEVMRFVQRLVETSPKAAAWERFGETEEGRPLPLVMLSSPPVSSPQAARALKRPIVFVMANIHGGEVEGKEASLMLARRLTSGDLKPLLKQIVVLIAPIYNADGNERVSVDHRPAQNGPIAGVGTRENANGLDLNRDYMKLESAEARALVGLLNRWDPHVVIDLHTTNGSYHGFHLTYSPTLNPDADPRLIGFARERLLPEVRDAMLKKHGFRTYYYGNFASERSLTHETSRIDPAHPGDTIWRTFDHRPRFGNNYVGLRNRIAVLSEAYSYLDFSGRVKATEAYVEEVLRASVRHAARILALTSQADRETRTMVKDELGVDFTLAPLDQPVEILVGDVEKKLNPRSGKEMLVMANKAVPVRMKDYGVFEASRKVAMPRGWLLPKPHVDSGRLALALGRLRDHGIEVEQVSASEVTVERFVIDEVVRSTRLFQGHHETRLKGHYEPARMSVHESAYFVPSAQNLARLAFYLLEPESDDGFVTWNIIDTGLAPGETYPIYRVTNGTFK